MEGKLTIGDLEKISKKAAGEIDPIKEMAIRGNGISLCCVDQTIAGSLQNVFSVEVNAGDITNQNQSGRCWMFAGLNVLRQKLFEKLGVKTIELSQAYLQFYDKLEKINFTLERAIELAGEPINSRLNAYILSDGIGDGGHWAMFASLVKKYGVVPSSAMKDTAVSKATSELNALLHKVVANDVKAIREMHSKGKADSEIRKKKEVMLEEAYRILALSLGIPPKKFALEYKDKNDKFVRLKEMSPKEFYDEYIGIDLDEWVSLSDAGTIGWEKGVRYTCHYVGNVEGGDPVVFFDVLPSEMKKAVVNSLKGGDIVWFAADVSAKSLRKAGLMSPALLRDDLLFGTKNKLSKGEELDYHVTYCNHAMAFTGANLANGKPNRFKIENSWGKDNGDGGFFVCDAAWFDSYVYQILVRKKYLPADLLKKYEESPIQDTEPFNGLWIGLN